MCDRFLELKVFIRAAESGSFSVTARELGLSQPSVSRIVSELEERLGVRLLLRSTRKIVPTKAGTVFLQKARQILIELEEAEASTRDEDSLQGVLRIAMPSILATRVVLPNLARFVNPHPLLKVELLTADSLQDLVAERVDVAMRFGRLKDSGFGVKKLTTLDRLLVAAPAYLAERSVPESPEALKSHDLIVGPTNSLRWPWTFTQGASTETIDVEPRYLLTSTEAAIVCAREGLGITRAAALMCQAELAAGQPVPVLADYTLARVDVNAVYPAGRFPSPKALSFAAFAAEILATKHQ